MLKTSLFGESARNHRRYVRVVSVNAFDEIQHCREVYQLINLVKAEHIYLFILEHSDKLKEPIFSIM